MKKHFHLFTFIILSISVNSSVARDDSRQLVEMPEMMQEHMRDHLVSINQILIYLADEKLDEAADVAESR